MLKDFIIKIRNSDYNRKRRWVIGASIVAMTIVLIIWLYQINNIIKPAATGTEQISIEDKSDFWPIMKKGAAILGDSIKHKLNNLFSGNNSGTIITNEK